MIIETAKMNQMQQINKLAIQVHNLHVNWRNDIFKNSQNVMNEERLKQLVDSQEIFVAIKNNEIIGFMIIAIKDKTDNPILFPKKYLVIDTIAVDENYRRQGVGTKLIKYAEEIGVDLECTDLYLTVNPENEIAINSYEKQGFKVKNIVYSKTISKQNKYNKK